MIKTFADRHTKDLYGTGKSKRLPQTIWKRALRKLEYLDLATGLSDLKVPPSNRFHELERERKGQYSISVNPVVAEIGMPKCFQRLAQSDMEAILRAYFGLH